MHWYGIQPCFHHCALWLDTTCEELSGCVDPKPTCTLTRTTPRVGLCSGSEGFITNLALLKPEPYHNDNWIRATTVKQKAFNSPVRVERIADPSSPKGLECYFAGASVANFLKKILIIHQSNNQHPSPGSANRCYFGMFSLT